MLGDVGSFVPFITVNEKSESNPDCNLHSSIAYFASGRAYTVTRIYLTACQNVYAAGIRK